MSYLFKSESSSGKNTDKLPKVFEEGEKYEKITLLLLAERETKNISSCKVTSGKKIVKITKKIFQSFCKFSSVL